MVNARKQLEYLIGDVVKYGNLFIESDAGRNWDKLGIGSTNSERLPWWATFYTDLIGSEFKDCISKLLDYPVNNYHKGQILEEIQDLFYKIKALEPANWDNTSIDKLKTSIATKPEVIYKYEKEFVYLYDNDVIDNYPWNGHERNDVIVIKQVNGDFKAILLESYFSIIDHYQNLEAQRIKQLEKQLINQERISNLYNKNIRELNNMIVDLQNQNYELKKEFNKDDLADSTGLDDLPSEVDREKMLLIYRLGFLEHSAWPEGATNLDVARMMSKFLNINVTSLERLRKAFVNNDRMGQRIIRLHDAKIKMIINSVFPKIDFGKQNFLVVLEKKK